MLRSARPEVVEDEEESVWLGAEVEGCVVRAREDRRGDIVKVNDLDRCFGAGTDRSQMQQRM